jgi:hypothetical protein
VRRGWLLLLLHQSVIRGEIADQKKGCRFFAHSGLSGGTDHNLVHVDTFGLFDRESDCPSDSLWG